MSNQRIEIIIQEINYWKEHKLLPDVYCNFLLALYTKGENDAEVADKVGDRRTGLIPIFQFIGQFLFLLLAVIVINMQHANIFFQVIFLFISVLGMLWLFKKLNKNRDVYSHLSTVILLVHFFLITVFLGNLYLNFNFSTIIIMVCNFICWLIIGYRLRLRYLQIIGIILMIFTIIYTFL